MENTVLTDARSATVRLKPNRIRNITEKERDGINTNFEYVFEDKSIDDVTLLYNDKDFEVIDEPNEPVLREIFIDELCSDTLHLKLPLTVERVNTLPVVVNEVVTKTVDPETVVYSDQIYLEPVVVYNCIKKQGFVKRCFDDLIHGTLQEVNNDAELPNMFCEVERFSKQISVNAEFDYEAFTNSMCASINESNVN